MPYSIHTLFLCPSFYLAPHMSIDDHNLQTPETQPPGAASLSNDSILDTTFEERHVPLPPRQNPMRRYIPNQERPSGHFLRRLGPQPSLDNGRSHGIPRHTLPDDTSLSSERTAPRRLWTRPGSHLPPTIEQATRTPEHPFITESATPAPRATGPITPPTRVNEREVNDSWLPDGREALNHPSLDSNFDPAASFGFYHAPIRPHPAPHQRRFLPFPLPPPPRQEPMGRPIAPSDGLGRRNLPSQPGMRDSDVSDMDFSMASFTSPSQPSFPHQPGHASRQHVAATDTRFPDPPTIESIQREVAYWRRSQTSQPSPQDNLSSSQPTALHATYMTPEARGSLPSRGGASSASSVGGSMDISAQSFEEIADEPSSAFVHIQAGPINQPSPTTHVRNRQPSNSSRVEDDSPIPACLYNARDISDTPFLFGHASHRWQDVADRPQHRVDNRIEEQHELELERNEEHTREDVPAGFEAGEGEDEAEEEEQRDEQEGDESNASSTHHLRDDQLEVLILENLGFHGNLTRRGEMVLLEESYYSETGTDSDDSQTRLESDSDELAIQLTRDGHAVVASHDAASAEDQAPSVIRVKKRRRVPGTTRNKTRGKKRGEEFNVEKRRRQWLSEKEDRALRRGPLMAVSEAEFKENMLDASEWKQLINHELSTTAWKYMPVVGPGFLPSANLAALGQSSAHVRPMPLSSIPSGPLHSTQHRSRNVNMAVLAASHEAIAYGQAGEEYGIRALPLALHYHEQQSEGTLEFSGRGRDDRRDTSGDRDTDSESDTEMAEDSLEKIVGPGHPTAKHTNTYLEGSFGRLAVHDPQRAMMLVEDSGHM